MSLSKLEAMIALTDNVKKQREEHDALYQSAYQDLEKMALLQIETYFKSLFDLLPKNTCLRIPIHFNTKKNYTVWIEKEYWDYVKGSTDRQAICNRVYLNNISYNDYFPLIQKEQVDEWYTRDMPSDLLNLFVEHFESIKSQVEQGIHDHFEKIISKEQSEMVHRTSIINNLVRFTEKEA